MDGENGLVPKPQARAVERVRRRREMLDCHAMRTYNVFGRLYLSTRTSTFFLGNDLASADGNFVAESENIHGMISPRNLLRRADESVR